MAVTHKLYGPSMTNMAKAALGDLSSTGVIVRVALMSTAHSFDQDDELWTDVSANEVSTGDYADYEPFKGGVALNVKAVTYSTRITTLSASSHTDYCSSGSIGAGFAVLRSSSYLLSCVDFGGKEESVNGEFKVNWNADGIATLTVAS